MDGIEFVPGDRLPKVGDEAALWLAFKNGRLLVSDEGEAPGVACTMDLSARGVVTAHEIYLGTLGGTHCFAAELADDGELPENTSLRELRPLFNELPADYVALVGRAAHLIHWHKTHQYCGSCGALMDEDEEVRAKRCPKCALLCFPRISPAVIVAVVKDGAILLARGPRFRHGLYSVLAGFVEPGESLEEAVGRELREEVGIEVKNLRYFGSQAWPFPDSLMIAFTAEYARGRIRIDGTEILEADWYRPDGLPLIPTRVSIARRLIDWFVEAHGGP